MNVIPTISWSTPDNFGWCFEGEPEGSVVVVSSVGVANSRGKKALFLAGYNEMLARLRPETILFYGKVPEECWGNIIQIPPFHKRFEKGSVSDGGRGASSGISKNGKKYGSEYKTVYQTDNIKFVKPNEGNTTAPMETQSKNRIYVTLDYKDELKFVSYYDKEGKRYKQIDLSGQAHKVDGVPTLPHTHMGYNHNENDDRVLDEEEKKIVARIKNVWYNRHNK